MIVKLDDMPDVMSANQTAKLLGLSAATVRMMCCAGDIPAVKPPRRNKWLIPKAGLVAWLEGERKPKPGDSFL